jgi:hypothetical protein
MDKFLEVYGVDLATRFEQAVDLRPMLAAAVTNGTSTTNASSSAISSSLFSAPAAAAAAPSPAATANDNSVLRRFALVSTVWSSNSCYIDAPLELWACLQRWAGAADGEQVPLELPISVERNAYRSLAEATLNYVDLHSSDDDDATVRLMVKPDASSPHH